MTYSGKHAIITGGANGIGRCVAEKLLNAGAFVSVIDIDAEVGKALSGRYKNLNLFSGDIAEKGTLDSFINSLDASRPVDILINNACVSRKGLISGCSWEDFEYVQRVGVTAPYYLTAMLLNCGLLSFGASIVYVAST